MTRPRLLPLPGGHMRSELKQQIDSLINNNAVVLFMKGTKEQPQCGFSKRVVEVLKKVSGDFITVDVLADAELREGIKVYSSWPTIPQLYIHGEFIGGCDIVLDMFAKNQLQSLLKAEKAEHKPTITLTTAAIDAFNNAAADNQDGEYIRLSIGADFEHSLSYDQRHPDDFCLTFGTLELLIDPYSASRADNLSIDFVKDQLDSGFAFNNPNEPQEVKELSVKELNAWVNQGKDALLIDVRPKWEWEKAHISFAKLLEEMSPDELSALKKDQTIVFHCHHGGRSKKAAEAFRARGFTKLYNLSGGIDAWSKSIDPKVPVYTK